VTTSSVIDWTLSTVSRGAGGGLALSLLVVKQLISFDLLSSSTRLLAAAQTFTLSSSEVHVDELLAGMTRMTSSAYLLVLFPGATVEKSDS